MTVNTQTECPFDKDLRAFRDHAMPEKRRDELREHIRTCDACKTSISLMKAIDAELKSWSNAEPHSNDPALTCSRRSRRVVCSGGTQAIFEARP